MVAPRIVTAAIVVTLVLALEAVARLGLVSPVTFVAPSRMAYILGDMALNGRLWPPLGRTLGIVTVAVVLSVVVGFAAGVAVHALPRLRHALEPVLASYYALPIFVFYPILVVLLGLNAWPLIVIGSLFGLVAVLIATLTALDRVPVVLLKQAHVMRLSPWQRLRHVRLPAMAPHLMAGLKLAVAYGIIGVIGGEFILATSGLGYAIAFAYNNFDTGRMYALMLAVIIVSVSVNLALHTLERRMRRKLER